MAKALADRAQSYMEARLGEVFTIRELAIAFEMGTPAGRDSMSASIARLYERGAVNRRRCGSGGNMVWGYFAGPTPEAVAFNSLMRGMDEVRARFR